MNPAEMVVLIILIVTIGRVLSNRNKYRHGAPQWRQDEQVEAQLRDEVRQLKERVQVLERVVTDEHKSLDLDREIARLRDR